MHVMSNLNHFESTFVALENMMKGLVVQ